VRSSALSDVYGAPDVKPENSTILLRGAVTESLDPKSQNLTGAKNEPDATDRLAA
jgi:hypothetical protein